MFEIGIDLKTPNVHWNCDRSENTQGTGMRLSISYVTKMFFSKSEVKGLESRNDSLIIDQYYIN
jgi:hypothetical protein